MRPCRLILSALFLTWFNLCTLLAYAGNRLPPGQPLETWPGKPLALPKTWLSPLAPVAKQSLGKTTVTESSFVSYQVNVNSAGQNIPGDAANEPSIAVDPTNPNRIAIGWRQFDTVDSSFRQAGNAWSNDGGRTWNNNPVLDPGVFRSDPVLRAGADGRFYYQSLKVVNLNQPNEEFTEDLWISDDGGQSWSGPVFSYGGDKLWFAIDNTGGVHQGAIYNIWNTAGNLYYPRTFNFSADGSIFRPPMLLPIQPVFGTITVGNEGEIYAVGVIHGQNGQQIWLLKSSQRDNQDNPVFSQLTPVDLGGELLLGHYINPVGLAGQIWVDVDRSNTPMRGTVYVLASVDPPGPDPMDVMLARSTDGGISFEAPVRVNDDPLGANNVQWFGTMAVAPNGRIDILWNDTRNAIAQHPAVIRSQLFFASSYDNGRSFTRNRAASPLFNQYLGYPQQQKLGDYYDMIAANDGSHLAWAATFNHEQDVYYLHAKPAAVTENPAFPAWLTDNVWHHPDYPRQGIVSKTVIGPGNRPIAFDAVFSYTPDGDPLWLILQAGIPESGDEFVLPVYLPTGDLDTNGTPLAVIGVARKSRLRDANGDLIASRMRYRLDFTESAMSEAQSLAASPDQFDETAYRNSPLFGSLRDLELQPLLPSQEERENFCSPLAAGLEADGEHSEGRLGFVFATGDVIFTAGADFTYEKTASGGQQQLVLDASGRAIPVWFTYDNARQNPPGYSTGQAELTVYRPNTGNGFFVASDSDWGLSAIHTETASVQESPPKVTVQRDNGVTEIMRPLAASAFCGSN